jgi:hypothetical protein
MGWALPRRVTLVDHDLHQFGRVRRHVAAQVEIENKIEAKL